MRSKTTYEDWNFTNYRSKGEKMTVPGCARGRGYVRVDATKEEIARGYRIVETKKEGDDLI